MDFEEEPQLATYSTMSERPTGQGGRKARRLATFILFIILTFALSTLGGAAGFVVLANTRTPFFETVRNKLGITDNTGVAVPIRQSLKLEESSSVIDATNKVSPAVVSISTSQRVSDYFGQVTDEEVSGGTGFIITSDGLIVTNNHVVSTAGSYKVVLNDGRIFDATIQATDTLNDFAVLKIDGKDLPTVELGSSDSLEVGQYAIAIGNALGEFKNSVSLGIISAKGRSITASGSTGSEKLTDLLQTDAAVNPGNSGGPLVNLAGQVIGINTAIASSGSNAGSIGVGFAIPIDTLKTAIDSVRKTGKIVRPYLGVRYRSIDKSYQQLNGLTVDHGALIVQGSATDAGVVAGSPAEKAGIKIGDIILEINGERIDGDNSIASRLRKYQVGDSITLKVRRDGSDIEVNVTLESQSQ